ncbi:hypothetical protein GRF29_44g903019, partial [Pseudopithomyces chartarum]
GRHQPSNNRTISIIERIGSRSTTLGIMCAVRRDTRVPEAVYQVPQRELLQPRLSKSTLQDAQERVRCAGSG